MYVQVTYLLASEDTVQREFGAFDGIRDGIKHCNIRDFLLMDAWY